MEGERGVNGGTGGGGWRRWRVAGGGPTLSNVAPRERLLVLFGCVDSAEKESEQRGLDWGRRGSPEEPHGSAVSMATGGADVFPSAVRGLRRKCLNISRR